MASGERRTASGETPRQVGGTLTPANQSHCSEKAREAYAPSPVEPQSASLNMNVTVGNGLNGSASDLAQPPKRFSDRNKERYPESTLVSNILNSGNSNSPSLEEPKVDEVGVLVSRKPLIAKPPDKAKALQNVA